MRAAPALLAAITVAALAGPARAAAPVEPSYLPGAAASRALTVTTAGAADAAITILTQAVAIEETGPKQTVARFGEVYAFSPSFIAVHQDEPTAISFWNLQPDDLHDVMLVGPDLQVLVKVSLPPVTERSCVFTFHREGLYTYSCTYHQPAMTGQILVLPPGRR